MVFHEYTISSSNEKPKSSNEKSFLENKFPTKNHLVPTKKQHDFQQETISTSNEKQ